LFNNKNQNKKHDKKKLKIAYLPAAQNQKRTGKGLKFKSIPSSQHVETTEWMVIAINK